MGPPAAAAAAAAPSPATAGEVFPEQQQAQQAAATASSGRGLEALPPHADGAGAQVLQARGAATRAAGSELRGLGRYPACASEGLGGGAEEALVGAEEEAARHFAASAEEAIALLGQQPADFSLYGLGWSCEGFKQRSESSEPQTEYGHSLQEGSEPLTEHGSSQAATSPLQEPLAEELAVPLWGGVYLAGFGPLPFEEGCAAPVPHLAQAGRAATGEWAWRMAPRPGLPCAEPLVVLPGRAPDGSATLEVASGLMSFADYWECGEDVDRPLGPLKCEAQAEGATMTVAELHAAFHGW